MKEMKLFKNFLFSFTKRSIRHRIINGRQGIFFLITLILHYKCHKISLNCEGSYIDSPEWLQNQKNNNKSQKNDGKYFYQYAITVALNHKNILKDPKRISKINSLKN